MYKTKIKLFSFRQSDGCMMKAHINIVIVFPNVRLLLLVGRQNVCLMRDG
jgi:hypothetical protein